MSANIALTTQAQTTPPGGKGEANISLEEQFCAKNRAEHNLKYEG